MRLYDEDDQDDAEESWSKAGSDSFNEEPDDADLRGSDDVKCVHCGRYIHEKAEICPYCKMWQADETNRSRKPLWFIIAAILTAAGFLLVWVLLGR